MRATSSAPVRRLVVVGSGAQFASRLAEACSRAGWTVSTLVPEDPMAMPPTAWAPIEARDEHHDLIEAVEDADAVITLGGVGAVTTVADDARTLDTVLAHARPGSVLLALSSIAVFGDAGSRPLTEADVPDPPDPLASARAAEIRVLTAGDWLRTVVVRVGLVYGESGGALLQGAVEIARRGGVSRYFGRESDIIPTVHEDDLASLVVDLLDRDDATGVFHAASGSTSIQGLARLVAARAGVDEIAAWDDASTRDVLGVPSSVPRVNVTTDVARSRASSELGWTPDAPSLAAVLTRP